MLANLQFSESRIWLGKILANDIQIYQSFPPPEFCAICVYVLASVYVCVHVCMYVCVHAYVCVYVRLCTCVYVCVYMHLCTCV